MTIDPKPAATVDVVRHPNYAVLSAGVRGGDGHAIAVHWTFSDGSKANGLRVVHRRPGTATLTVVDGAGDTATKTVGF